MELDRGEDTGISSSLELLLGEDRELDRNLEDFHKIELFLKRKRIAVALKSKQAP